MNNQKPIEIPDTHIELHDVTVEFWNNGNRLRVLQSFDLDVPKTQFISIIGPSGCGKTTLLRLVAGLINPTTGQIHVDGMTADAARQQRLASFVFQSPVLFPWRNVLKNVLLPFEIMRGDGVKKDADERLAREMISLVGLHGFEDAYPHQLSGGMQSRVAIARALTSSPKILLMDEPFGDLDELTRTRLNMELLKIWHEMKATVIFVTHSVSEAILLSDRVIALGLRPSCIVEDVNIDLDRPRHPDMQQSEAFAKYGRILKRSIGME
jgi:NitT/TauT family transport system ATP-binding protein